MSRKGYTFRDGIGRIRSFSFFENLLLFWTEKQEKKEKRKRRRKRDVEEREEGGGEISFSEFIVHVHAKYCNDLCEFQADLSLGVERVCSRSILRGTCWKSKGSTGSAYPPVARESLSKKINCIIDVNFALFGGLWLLVPALINFFRAACRATQGRVFAHSFEHKASPCSLWPRPRVNAGLFTKALRTVGAFPATESLSYFRHR